MMKELLENARVIEDENGGKQKILSIGGLYVDEQVFAFGRGLKNNKTFPLLDDDIFLATHPKTGR